MSGEWLDYGFSIGMPHMVPNKLSEVELLKWLGAYQWESISKLLGYRSHEITNLEGERLYASFINVELGFPPTRPIEAFEEGATVTVKNRVGVYGRRFVEGLLLFDREPILASVTDAIASKEGLVASERPFAYVTNAFISRSGANTKLKICEPKGMDGANVVTLKTPPVGIGEHRTAQAGGAVGGVEAPGGSKPLRTEGAAEIVYKISPESDLNGAALLYFARYVAMMDYGVRRYMCETLARPVSSALVECLSTQHRRIFYFVNADPSDSVRIFVTAWRLPGEPTSLDGRSTLARILYRLELYRASDGALMAISEVTKALCVPERDKSLVNEATRFLASV